MFHLKSSPASAPLLDVVHRLETAGLVVALGGSGLLGALGLASEARDWDLTTDAAPADVAERLSGIELELVGPGGIHADHKVRSAGGTIEIICGFAIRSGDGVVHIPTAVSARVDGVPIGSPEAWAIAYALLGRDEKSQRLFQWLAEHGAHGAVVTRLLAEPLPDGPARRLATLPRTSQGTPGG
jgi:hypothetical protein